MNRFAQDAELYTGPLNRESLSAADGVKYFGDTLRPHFKGAQSVFLWRCFSNHSREKTTRPKGQVDWNILVALETLEGLLDGHVADIRPELRAKNKISILPT